MTNVNVNNINSTSSFIRDTELSRSKKKKPKHVHYQDRIFSGRAHMWALQKVLLFNIPGVNLGKERLLVGGWWGRGINYKNFPREIMKIQICKLSLLQGGWGQVWHTWDWKRANACTGTSINCFTSASLNNESPSSPPCHLFDSTANVAPRTVQQRKQSSFCSQLMESKPNGAEGEQTQKMDDLPRHRTSPNLLMSPSFVIPPSLPELMQFPCTPRWPNAARKQKKVGEREKERKQRHLGKGHRYTSEQCSQRRGGQHEVKESVGGWERRAFYWGAETEWNMREVLRGIEPPEDNRTRTQCWKNGLETRLWHVIIRNCRGSGTWSREV